MKPMILSHHPSCLRYKDHTINIGKIKLCIGCFVGYPTTILTFIICYFMIIPNLDITWWLYLIGGILFSMNLLSLTNLTDKKRLKIFQKASIGIGAGIILALSLKFLSQYSSILQAFLMYLGVIILIIPLGLLHYRTFKYTCRDCKLNPPNNQCPFK